MLERLFCANQEVNEEFIGAQLARQARMIKPQGSLGRLEEIAMRLASHQKTETPAVNKPWISVFVADHGVCAQDISDSEQSMTKTWVEEIVQGHAAINVLADYSQAELEVIDLGLTEELEANEMVRSQRIAAGTQDFSQQPAMTQEQMLSAMEVGMQAAERAKEAGADLFIGGEMGVGNTTSALAMVAVLSGKDPIELLGMEKGMVMRSERAKAEMVSKALESHQALLTSPLRVLQTLGGFETAALCGAYIRCAQLGLTVVVDGLMATTAAWIADLVSRNDQLLHCKSEEMLMDLGKYSMPETMFCICGTCPRLVEWCFFAHQSEEAFHALVLEILAVDAMLSFDMRLGQASGAATVIPLIQQACALNSQMRLLDLPEEAVPANSEECAFFQ